MTSTPFGYDRCGPDDRHLDQPLMKHGYRLQVTLTTSWTKLVFVSLKHTANLKVSEELDIAFGGRPMATLFSAKESCQVANPADSCKRNAAIANPALNNLYTSPWYGDDGSNQALNVINGPDTVATDLLYTSTTEREAFRHQ